MSNKDTCLIVEGGGFRTGFTTGILDAFSTAGYRPFNQYIGVSGGSIALSYFISQQYRTCLSAIVALTEDKHFLQFKRTLSEKGFMDIDYIGIVAQQKVKLDIPIFSKTIDDCPFYIVATERETGKPKYFSPTSETLVDQLIASCTLPFVTKGKHFIDGVEYFDGGWSDPLPAQWAYSQGVRRILVLRTWPTGQIYSQTWPNYFGSLYFKSQPQLKRTFDLAHETYNQSIQFIENPPSDLNIVQINPTKILKSGTYSSNRKTIMKDYRYGLDVGLNYVNTQMNMNP